MNSKADFASEQKLDRLGGADNYYKFVLQSNTSGSPTVQATSFYCNKKQFQYRN